MWQELTNLAKTPGKKCQASRTTWSPTAKPSKSPSKISTLKASESIAFRPRCLTMKIELASVKKLECWWTGGYERKKYVATKKQCLSSFRNVTTVDWCLLYEKAGHEFRKQSTTNTFSLLLNVPQILKTRVRSFWEIWSWPIWFLIDPV